MTRLCGAGIFTSTWTTHLRLIHTPRQLPTVCVRMAANAAVPASTAAPLEFQAPGAAYSPRYIDVRPVLLALISSCSTEATRRPLAGCQLLLCLKGLRQRWVSLG